MPTFIIRRLACALSLVIVATGVMTGVAGSPSAELMDSLERRLEELNSPVDSVHVLLNIFDVSHSESQRYGALERACSTAKRNKMYDDQISIITYTANVKRDNDSILKTLIDELSALPESPRQKEARLFIRMVMLDNAIKRDNFNMQADHLSSLLKQYEAENVKDPYEKAFMLYSLCKHLGMATRGSVLEEYVNKLQDHVERMNLPMGSVRNLVYTRVAPIFVNNGNASAAIAVDKKMLNIIDSLVLSYKMQGRNHRNMYTNKYAIYRRLMMDYKALRPEEVDMFYDLAKDLARKDVRVAADMKRNRIVDICYKMAKGDYHDVIPMIKSTMELPYMSSYRTYMLKAIVEAAQATNDKAALLEATLELNDSLQRRLENRSEERYRELQILYDTVELQNQNNDLRVDEQRGRLRVTRTILVIVVLALICLGALTIFLLIQYRKYHKLAREHFQTTLHLREERSQMRKAQRELIAAREEALQSNKMKSEFINTMSHEVRTPLNSILEYSQLILDCIPEDKKQYLERYAYTMEQNIKMIITLLNDVLDTTSLEYGNIAIHKEPVSVQDMCKLALDNVFDNAARGDIKVVFNPDAKPDHTIVTDKFRVCQVLINLLGNADKFTSNGTVTLDYDIDLQKGTVSFIVSDTGIGIPDKCDELIFQRFYKVSNKTRGCGLGLYISRMLANLLHGSLKLDRTYHNGSRFIFTIPE